jgi:hypothetical protein
MIGTIMALVSLLLLFIPPIGRKLVPVEEPSRRKANLAKAV